MDDAQKDTISHEPDNFRLFGTVASGNAKGGYAVNFDCFPAGHKTLIALERKCLKVLDPGAEEVQRTDDADDFAEISKEKKIGPAKESANKFKEQEEEDIAKASFFEYAYGKEPGEFIKWEILPDGVNITEAENPYKHQDELHLKKDIDYKDETQYDNIFFEDFFPDITGHAERMDKFYNNVEASFYATYRNDKIKFHNPEADDPDWIVKQCYMLMIAAITEADCGIDNLWRQGQSYGRHSYANFGQYIPKNWFLCFIAAAPYMWCDEKWWHTDLRDLDWDVFKPCLQSFNNKRKALFVATVILLDESMFAWKPKTSQYGGLPNLTFEPRKPVDLGTQLRDAVECLSGVLVYGDVLELTEVQRMKKFYYSDPDNLVRGITSLPLKDEISAHTAEVLWQIEGSGIQPGGWCGGDAWFGSVMSSVEVYRRFEVHTTFVVKNNDRYFPTEALHAVMKARHAEQPSGHWVVMKATISDVNLLAIAYAWSQKGVSYFISTCGSTEASNIKYESKFEDEWGKTNFKEIPRPKILHYLYEHLPLIDEHNKQRQSVLSLEKRWLTKDPWFRLLTSVVGLCVVDMFRHYRHTELKVIGESQVEIDNMRIIRFSDHICSSLKLWQRRRPTSTRANAASGVQQLRRITAKDSNSTTAKPTPKQLLAGRTTGTDIRLSCFICRRYINDKGVRRWQQTTWWCKDCHMPLCKQSRVGQDGGRTLTCLEEHLCSEEDIFKCLEVKPRGAEVPLELTIDLHARASKRNQSHRGHARR